MCGLLNRTYFFTGNGFIVIYIHMNWTESYIHMGTHKRNQAVVQTNTSRTKAHSEINEM